MRGRDGERWRDAVQWLAVTVLVGSGGPACNDARDDGTSVGAGTVPTTAPDDESTAAAVDTTAGQRLDLGAETAATEGDVRFRVPAPGSEGRSEVMPTSIAARS